MIGDSYRAAELKRRQLLDAGRRHWFDDHDDARTAPHEAGHVVAGFLLGISPKHASIDGGHGYAGRTFLDMRRSIVLSL